MTVEQAINVLVIIMLIEMMVAIGLSVSFGDLLSVARNWRLILKAFLANYICVPAVTVGLLILFQPPDPLVAVGFLIIAVCPGAPFGPPCTKLAKGNLAVATGLMVILAGSSAIAAPLLLSILLPWMSGDEVQHVNSLKIISTLLVTQLLPLCVGLAIRYCRPRLADILQKPANLVSTVLGLFVVVLILVVHFHLLINIALRAWVGMSALLMGSLAFGWLLGGPGNDCRKAVALTTALRNLGVALVIATGDFSGTVAVTATIAYGIFEIVGVLLLALGWAYRGANLN